MKNKTRAGLITTTVVAGAIAFIPGIAAAHNADGRCIVASDNVPEHIGDAGFGANSYGQGAYFVDGLTTGVPFNGGFVLYLSGNVAHTVIVTAPDWPTATLKSPVCTTPAPTTTLAPPPPPSTDAATTTTVPVPPPTDGAPTTVGAPTTTVGATTTTGVPPTDAATTTTVITMIDSPPTVPDSLPVITGPADSMPPQVIAHTCIGFNDDTGYGTYADTVQTCHRCDLVEPGGVFTPDTWTYTFAGNGSYVCAPKPEPVLQDVTPTTKALAAPTGSLPETGATNLPVQILLIVIALGGGTLLVLVARRRNRSAVPRS